MTGLHKAVPLAAAALLASACAPLLPLPSQTEMETRPSAASGRLRPMPVRPLDLKTDCRYTDEDGYAVRLQLELVQSQAHVFNAAVDVPRRGSCRFDGPFTQVRRLPSVELRASDGCSINIWAQGEQVTVGFANCARRCTHGAFDYIWPIIVDRASSQCH